MDYILFLRLSLDQKIFNREEIEQLEYVNKDRLAELISSENPSNEKYEFSPWFLLIARNFLLKGESWSKIESIDQITDKKIYKL
uniref:Nudix hydrolase domain-containing protein n=1 Tax=Romanomermis culicivorax TaxID=13658 RepID=A0A915HM74_ROMCU